MNRRRSWVFAVVSSFLFGIGGCEMGDGGQDLEAIPFVPMTEDLRIGAVDDPEYAFSTVVALEVSPSGTIFSLHPQESAVRRWSPEGHFEGMIGRRGEGPGEFTQPLEMGWHGDSLWVFDSSRNSRISFFDADGTYVGALTPQVDLGSAEQSSQGIFPARPAGLLSDGTIYGATPAFSHAVVDGTLTSIAHVRMDPDGRTVDTLLTTPVGRSNVLGVLRDGGGTFMSQPFSDADLVFVEHDRTSLLTLERRAALDEGQHEFRLTRVNLAGDTVFSRNYPYQPVPVTADTIQKAIDSAAEGLHGFVGERTGTTLEQWRGWIRDAIYVPDYYAPVREVVSGRDGTIWLARNPAGGTTVEWLILKRNGEPVGRTETPAGFRLFLADRSMLWGVLRDDTDVEYIVRYRAERL